MELITAREAENILYLIPHGRIDSANAAETEEQAERLRRTHPSAEIVLDLEDLQYISSAGLRVILRLRKEVPTLRMINASGDIYDILEMTGFAEMIPVEKAYRRLSVEGCEVIGTGANGMVYRLDPDTIIKVYRNADALPDIRRERELARRAFVLGIPTAIPYDVVRVGDSYGSVFELLSAKSLSKCLAKAPEDFDRLVRIYVDLLKKIHATEVLPDDMPDMKKTALDWADFLEPYLSHEKWQKLHALVAAVPENYHMIHGDYHTKNVMLQDGEALLIDMDTLAHGDPVFEFASIFNAYIGFYAGAPSDGTTFLGISTEMAERFWKQTLRLYFGTEDEAALRCAEEKASLLGFTRLMRRLIRRGGPETEDGRARIAFYRERIESLTDAIDSLKL